MESAHWKQASASDADKIMHIFSGTLGFQIVLLAFQESCVRLATCEDTHIPVHMLATHTTATRTTMTTVMTIAIMLRMITENVEQKYDDDNDANDDDDDGDLTMWHCRCVAVWYATQISN